METARVIYYCILKCQNKTCVTSYLKGPLYFSLQDTKPLEMEKGVDFERRMTFVESMLDLNENYRHFDFLEHPAVIERLKVRDEEVEEEGEEGHDEL